jgi:hypothetical protein
MSGIEEFDNDDYDPLDSFAVGKTISLQQILNNLIQKDENLFLKTRIQKPQKLATMKVIAKLCKEVSLDETGESLDMFIEILCTFMVSYKGKSREEIVDALKSLMEKRTTKLSLSESLMKDWDE